MTQVSPQGEDESEMEVLKRVDAGWRLPRARACKLLFEYLSGGQVAIAVPEEAICRLRLDQALVRRLLPPVLSHRVYLTGSISLVLSHRVEK